MSAVFITGSGTGVGKTYVAASLIRHLRGRGQKMRALKPVVSGFDPAKPSGSDPAILLDALGCKVTLEELDRISPWRFLAPLSPDMAARAENKKIDFDAVADFCRSAIAENGGVLVIEGIGGIMVPLDEHHTMLNLMVALGLPLILVGGSYLGTLSHVLSAQDVILHRSLHLRAIVISESEGSPPALHATLATLAHFAKAPLIGLRRDGPLAEKDAAIEKLAQLTL